MRNFFGQNRSRSQFCVFFLDVGQCDYQIQCTDAKKGGNSQKTKKGRKFAFLNQKIYQYFLGASFEMKKFSTFFWWYY